LDIAFLETSSDADRLSPDSLTARFDILAELGDATFLSFKPCKTSILLLSDKVGGSPIDEAWDVCFRLALDPFAIKALGFNKAKGVIFDGSILLLFAGFVGDDIY